MVRHSRAVKTLEHGRRSAESLMVDKVRILHPTGNVHTDPVIGFVTPEYTIVYEGKCKVQTAGGIASQVVSASGDATNVGGNVPVWSLYLHIPWNIPNIQVGDLAVITHSNIPNLQDTIMRLVNLQSEKTWCTAQRWNVSEMPPEIPIPYVNTLYTYWEGEPNNSVSVLSDGRPEWA